MVIVYMFPGVITGRSWFASIPSSLTDIFAFLSIIGGSQKHELLAARPRVRSTEPPSWASSGQLDCRLTRTSRLTPRPPGSDQVIGVPATLTTTERTSRSSL